MRDQLSLDLREYDLPPYWDGVPVEWDGEWEYAPDVCICPPPKDTACDDCGSRAIQLMQNGIRGPLPTSTHIRNGQSSTSGQCDRLIVFRCPNCLADTVVDADRNVWALSLEDYGPHGSSSPADCDERR